MPEIKIEQRIKVKQKWTEEDFYDSIDENVDDPLCIEGLFDRDIDHIDDVIGDLPPDWDD